MARARFKTVHRICRTSLIMNEGTIKCPSCGHVPENQDKRHIGTQCGQLVEKRVETGPVEMSFSYA